MSNKNKTVENNGKQASEKIGYSIRTMASDLENKDFSTSSFDLSHQKPEASEKKEETPTKTKIQPIRKEKVKITNPFLKDLKFNDQNDPKEPFEKKPELKPRERKEIKSSQNPKNNLQKIEKVKFPKTPPARSASVSPVLEEDFEDKDSINSKLLIVLFFISLVAVGAGIYYFSFATKTSSIAPTPTPEVTPPKIETPIVTAQKTIPKKLKDSEVIFLNIQEDSLSPLLLTKKESLSTAGVYYQLQKEDFVPVSSPELLSLLELQFPEEIQTELTSNWMFLYPQEDTLKLSLIFKIREDSSAVSDFLKNNEYRLPALLKPLFVDETFVLQEEQVVFRDSGEVEGIRHYNFVENLSDKAIDWGILEDTYLILSTSKEVVSKLITDLKNEGESLDNLVETELENLQN